MEQTVWLLCKPRQQQQRQQQQQQQLKSQKVVKIFS